MQIKEGRNNVKVNIKVVNSLMYIVDVLLIFSYPINQNKKYNIYGKIPIYS